MAHGTAATSGRFEKTTISVLCEVRRGQTMNVAKRGTEFCRTEMSGVVVALKFARMTEDTLPLPPRRRQGRRNRRRRTGSDGGG